MRFLIIGLVSATLIFSALGACQVAGQNARASYGVVE